VKVSSTQYQMPPVPTSYPAGISRGGPHRVDVREARSVGLLPQHSTHPLGLTLASLEAGVNVHHMNQAVERWIPLLAAELYFLPIEKSVVLAGSGLNNKVVGTVGLNDYQSRSDSPSRSPRYLTEELEGALTSTEVGEVYSDISQDHTN